MADPGARIAVLFLQPQCNMTCTFCITRDGFQAMTESQAAKLILSLEAKGVRNLILGGGEPLSWPHGIVGTAKFAKAHGMFVQVGTNGIALTDKLIAAPEIDRFILPLESADAVPHDSMRILKGGHHAVVLDRLDRAAALGKPVTVSTVVTRKNLNGLTALADFLSRYRERGGGLHAWHLYRMLSQGRGGSLHGRDLATGLDDYRSACREVRSLHPDIRIYQRPDMLRSATVGFFWMEAGTVRSHSPFGGI